MRADEPRQMVKIATNGKTYIGKILASDQSNLVVLRRNGTIKTIPVLKSNAYEKLSNSFEPYSDLELAQQLAKRFSKGYEISRTGRYVVVHPKGTADEWARPFEQLYSQFHHYFSVRGFQPRSAEFPLVVIVLDSRNQFMEVARKHGSATPHQLAGFFSPKSNQVITFVQTGSSGLKGSNQRDENRLTLIHEALHQYAFNTGIQSRWSPNPRWLSEGLARMFEARGVYDSRKFTNLADRVHRIDLPQMKEYIRSGRGSGFINRLVRSDQLFSTDMLYAYTCSWSLMFYLAEKEPAKLAQYMKTIARKKPFAGYDSADRLEDFAKYFGADFTSLENRVVRFIEGLK